MQDTLRFKEVSQVIRSLPLKWNKRLSTEIEIASHVLDWMNVSVRDIYLHDDDADIRSFVIKNKPDCVEILSDNMNARPQVKIGCVVCENFQFSDGVIPTD